MSLKYEPSSEPLRISAKQFFLKSEPLYVTGPARDSEEEEELVCHRALLF